MAILNFSDVLNELVGLDPKEVKLIATHCLINDSELV